MTVRSTSDTPPTDLELMLHADGELDAARRAEVEAWLASADDGEGTASPERRAAHAKLAALGLVSGVVRESALAASASAGADGIAAAVMGRLDARKPANDTARRTYVLAAATFVAAAAAVLLWIQPFPFSGGGPVAHRGSAPAPGLTAVDAFEPDMPNTETEAEAEHPGDVSVEHAVEVSAVDFGGRTGAVLYVPGETSASSTTVVWLSDDSAEEDE
jgi:hypothetical protein